MHEMKPFRNTWMGVPGELTEFRTVRTRPHCRRVAAIRWPEGNPGQNAEPGDVTFTVITGDGSRLDHVVELRGLLNNPTPEYLRHFAEVALSRPS